MSKKERERRNLVGPPSFNGERMKEGPRAFQAAAIMHREKCAWGQTGQKNVMALLVLMADLLRTPNAPQYCRMPTVLIAGTTSSLDYVEAQIVKMAVPTVRDTVMSHAKQAARWAVYLYVSCLVKSTLDFLISIMSG